MGDVSLVTNDLKLAKQQQDHHAQHECQNYNAEVHQPKNSVRTKGSAGEKTPKVYKDKVQLCYSRSWHKGGVCHGEIM